MASHCDCPCTLRALQLLSPFRLDKPGQHVYKMLGFNRLSLKTGKNRPSNESILFTTFINQYKYKMKHLLKSPFFLICDHNFVLFLDFILLVRFVVYISKDQGFDKLIQI